MFKKRRMPILAIVSMAIIVIPLMIYGCGAERNETEMAELKTVEVTEYQGENLSSVNAFRENSIEGPQQVDVNNYQLQINGLVQTPVSYKYNDVINQDTLYKKVVTLNCVEGWRFTAKWTGPALNAIFDDAKVRPKAKIAIFHTTDVPGGYSSLDLNYQ